MRCSPYFFAESEILSLSDLSVLPGNTPYAGNFSMRPTVTKSATRTAYTVPIESRGAMTVYADILFLVDASRDLVVLWLCARLFHRELTTGRLLGSAAIGGLYGTLSVVWNSGGISGALMTVAVSALLVLIAFGRATVAQIVRRAAVVWGAAALLGGIMTAICATAGRTEVPSGGGNTVLLLAGSAVCVILTRLILRCGGKRSVTVRLTLDGRSCEFAALCDSGNLVREPLSSRPVILADRSVLRTVVPELCRGGAVPERIPDRLSSRIRLIPVNGALGGGMLTGFSADSVEIVSGGRERACDALIAVSSGGGDFFGGFPANVPAVLV